MRREELIDAALARRNFGPQLRGRIERLLDGVEKRERLQCCNSGCFVCVQELKEIVAEVEVALGVQAPRGPAQDVQEPLIERGD